MAPRPNHDESARLDLVEGVRSFNYLRLVKPLLDEYPDRVKASVEAGGTEPVSKEEAGELYNRDARFLFACALQRTMQQMGWKTAADSVARSADSFLPELEDSKGVKDYSMLELDPDLPLPDWYTQFDREGKDDIHLVPGGYWGNPLIGAVYNVGGAAYRLAWRAGYDARPGALDAFVNSYGDTEKVRRAIDLGCSFGGLTRVIRKACPNAEVIGVDLSAPALSYAHQVAEAGKQEIIYSQRDAEHTGYEPDSFDLVTAFLLLHEVPDDVRASIAAEAFRLLAPGGQVMFLDIPPYAALSPEQAYFESFDGRGNGENHWEEFLVSDFKGLLSSVGFDQVTDGPLDFDEPGYWGSSALWRTGDFDAVHRWVTRAVKPAN